MSDDNSKKENKKHVDSSNINTKNTSGASTNKINSLLGKNPNFSSSLISSTVVASALSPVTRGIIQSLQHSRDFFLFKNFLNPYSNVSLQFFSRTISSTSYYFAQGFLNDLIIPEVGDNRKSKALVGIGSGIFNSLCSHWCGIIKSHGWMYSPPKSGLQTIKFLYSNGGAKFFIRGLPMGVVRDVAFGAVYEVTRGEVRQFLGEGESFSKDLSANMCGATLGTTLSFLPQYIKSKQQMSSPYLPCPSAYKITNELVADSVVASASFDGRFRYVNMRICLFGLLLESTLTSVGTQVICDKLKENFQSAASSSLK